MTTFCSTFVLFCAFWRIFFILAIFFIFLSKSKSCCEKVVLQTYVWILCFIQNTSVHATTNVYHVDMVCYNKNNRDEMVWILQAKNNLIDFSHDLISLIDGVCFFWHTTTNLTLMVLVCQHLHCFEKLWPLKKPSMVHWKNLIAC